MLIHHDGYSNGQNPNKWSELQVMPYLLNERLVAKSTNKKTLFTIHWYVTFNIQTNGVARSLVTHRHTHTHTHTQTGYCNPSTCTEN